MTKTEYVHYYLAPLVCAIDERILAVTYGTIVDKEYVYCMYRGGYKRINVTGDSLSALTTDVIRRIA
ncbi:MAG: hypothetical protein HFE63_11080 [Clostridiales bacterium]|nr:hypothetical protein [Clostridiales bacterium]